MITYCILVNMKQYICDLKKFFFHFFVSFIHHVHLVYKNHNSIFQITHKNNDDFVLVLTQIASLPRKINKTVVSLVSFGVKGIKTPNCLKEIMKESCQFKNFTCGLRSDTNTSLSRNIKTRYHELNSVQNFAPKNGKKYLKY